MEYSLVGKLSDIFTLNFGSSNIKKISYAASIGKSKFNAERKNTLSTETVSFG